MTDTPFNALTFAADLEQLKASLDHSCHEYLPIEQRDPASLGFLTVISELTAGTDPTAAVTKAMNAYRDLKDQRRKHDESVDARRRQDEQDLEVEEEITRKVECPHCGSAAGLKCVGKGASGGLRKKSHRPRYNLARSLNDVLQQTDD